MFYGHFFAHGKLNGPSDIQRLWSEVQDETPFRYAHAEIRTRVVAICNQLGEDVLGVLFSLSVSIVRVPTVEFSLFSIVLS